MSILLMIGGALAAAQGAGDASPLSPDSRASPPPAAAPSAADGARLSPPDGPPSGNPATLPLIGKGVGSFNLLRRIQPGAEPPPKKPVEINAALLPSTPPKKGEEPAPTPQAAAADRWDLMRELQGTMYGKALDDHRMYLYGWVEGSRNFSSAAQSNLTVTWTDRANEFMLQQGWVRFGRSVVTSGTTDVSFGFQVDVLMGSDYRFTLPRGLFNSQLQNATGQQNIYGVDPIQHYAAMYVPGFLGEGSEFRVGRVYCPWGVESLEAISTPLITRSYAFNYCPPFTHCGVGMYTTFSKEWSGMFMVVNGNDIYFGAAAQEWRGVGGIKWTSPNDGQDTVQVSTSLGRGAFNQGAPYAAPTAALANEPFGRNNFNAFDIVWTHKFSDVLSSAVEAIYGYQTNVPVAAAPGLPGPTDGNAHWASAAGYLFYTLNPTTTLTTRLEAFDDFQGQRTGFEGMYLAATAGVQYKPTPDLIMRCEARYDHNVETRPFEGKPGIFVIAADIILRF